jgi:predicted methyltransferase
MCQKKYTTAIEVNIYNDHISGLLGETILKFFLKEKLIELNEKFYNITLKGWEILENIGIDVNDLSSNKINIDICTENKNGILFEHIGSRLGVLIKEKLLELSWIEHNYNKIILTEKGENGLVSLGITIKRVIANKNT